MGIIQISYHSQQKIVVFLPSGKIRTSSSGVEYYSYILPLKCEHSPCVWKTKENENSFVPRESTTIRIWLHLLWNSSTPQNETLWKSWMLPRLLPSGFKVMPGNTPCPSAAWSAVRTETLWALFLRSHNVWWWPLLLPGVGDIDLRTCTLLSWFHWVTSIDLTMQQV